MKTEGHKNFHKSLERMLAGKQTGRKSGSADDGMLELSAELVGARPEPRPEFTAMLDERIASITGVIPAENPSGKTAASHGGSLRFWSLPTWLTLHRAAGALAVLVIGLGAFGLTRAMISGEFGGVRNGAQSVSDTTTGTSSKVNEGSPDGLYGPAGNGGSQSRSAENGSAGPAGISGAPFPTSGIAGDSAIAGLPSTQKVMQTASYEIEVPKGDFQASYDRINAMAGKYGGYVVSAETRKSGEDQPLTGTISIRVATAQDGFTRALAELDGVGTVLVRDISGQDVTEEFVDLQSRLRNAEAQEAQLLALMQKAQTIDEILIVQSRLSEIQSQIEQIKGRINYMESRTDFATISVSLRESGAAAVTPSSDTTTDWGFVDSLVYAGWLAVQSLNFIIMSLGVIVPLALIGGIVFAAGRWFRRRRES